jgi:hypothetical protein
VALSRRSEGRGGTVCDATRSASIAGFERKMRNLGGPRTPLFFFPRGWIVSSSRAFRSGGMVRRRYRREIDLNPALASPVYQPSRRTPFALPYEWLDTDLV